MRSLLTVWLLSEDRSNAIGSEQRLNEQQEYKPGLDGVIASITKLSYLDTDIEQIIVRGYDLIELIKTKNYTDVAYLLINEELPDPKRGVDFGQELVCEADLPNEMYEMFKLLPKSMSVMDALRTGLSILGGYENPDSLMDTSQKSNSVKAMKILSKAPTIAVNSYRAIKNMDFVKPDPSLSYVENFLYMIKGRKPTTTEADVLDKILTAYIEHEMPNSTFVVRVVASTLSDIFASTASAVASLKGPLHGGANEAAIKMFLEIYKNGGSTKAKEIILNKLKNKEKVMGFGHRVYMKKYDPRAYLLKDYIKNLTHLRDNGEELHKIYQTIEETVVEQKGLYPNADYPIALLYYLIGVPIDLYTPIFLCSRAAGLVAHHIEQHQNNRLFRPRVIYEGPRGLKV